MRKYHLFFLLLLVLTVSQFVHAQKELEQTIPTDPNVKIGKLENGMTYYIRQNSKPENRLELRLVVNAGSILEDEDQLGLAHFTEHMAFNGSKHFDKNELVSYLQSVGVKFGGDLNAYTSFDETVYILPIPSDDEEIVEKGFLVLEDWASGLNFDHEEIDKERGVVLEEWRLGRGADQRMLEKNLPVIYQGSRYAERLPIGTEEVLKKFKYDVIKRFYKDWYRPDLMAVVAVGDLPVAEIEKKIKDHFAHIKPVKNPRERASYQVPDHGDTYITVASDKEASFTRVNLYYKKDAEKPTQLSDLRSSLSRNLYATMLNHRLSELREKAEPPFIFGGSYYGGTWARTKDAYQSYAMVSETGVEDGLRALLTENERVRRHGFTATELARAKTQLLTNQEKAFKEKDKTESERYIYSYVNHFLEGSPMTGIEFQLEFSQKHLPGISLEEINNLAKEWITDHNRVVVVTAPDKEGVEIPSEEKLLALFAEVEKSDIAPYEEAAVAESLMAVKPVGGMVKSSQLIYNDGLNITELTLSNGIKVVLKPTDFKNDEVLMSAYSKGGQSLVADDDHYSASYASQIVGESGLGTFSKSDLNKMLTGKVVNVRAYIGRYNEGISGNAAPKDLEEMLQLVHLHFTAPRQDQEAFTSFINKNKALYANLATNPNFFFNDKVIKVLAQNHPRAGGFPTVEELDQVKYEKVHQIFRERFADAADFTFFFVGNFNEKELRPLLETYLGSLPATQSNENYRDLGIRPPKGVVREDVFKGEDQKSMVRISFTGEAKYEERTAHQLKSFSEILTIKLIEKLREDKGGVYGVGAFADMSKDPYENYSINVSFPCGPENVADLKQAVFSEIEKIMKEGPSAEDLAKIKEAQRREREVKLKENQFWLGALQDVYKDSRRPLEILAYDRYIGELTAADIQRVAREFVDMNNYVEVTLFPQGYVKEPEGAVLKK